MKIFLAKCSLSVATNSVENRLNNGHLEIFFGMSAIVWAYTLLYAKSATYGLGLGLLGRLWRIGDVLKLRLSPAEPSCCSCNSLKFLYFLVACCS